LSDDDLIREAREAFELAADAEAENRREAAPARQLNSERRPK
jgi:hypothetical protein